MCIRCYERESLSFRGMWAWNLCVVYEMIKWKDETSWNPTRTQHRSHVAARVYMHACKGDFTDKLFPNCAMMNECMSAESKLLLYIHAWFTLSSYIIWLSFTQFSGSHMKAVADHSVGRWNMGNLRKLCVCYWPHQPNICSQIRLNLSGQRGLFFGSCGNLWKQADMGDLNQGELN